MTPPPPPSRWTPAPPTTAEVDLFERTLSDWTTLLGSERLAVAALLSAYGRHAAMLGVDELTAADCIFNAYRDVEV